MAKETRMVGNVPFLPGATLWEWRLPRTRSALKLPLLPNQSNEVDKYMQGDGVGES